MTTQKTFKRRVRARAAKTGESYATSRSQLLAKTADAPLAADVQVLTGMTDEALERGSGKRLGEWLRILDAWGATERKHPEIARWLVAEEGIGGWWAQSVTVAYERVRGMRAMHQQPGGFAIAVTRTIRATPERISEAFTDGATRVAWLPDAPISVRTSRPGKSARFDWSDPPSRVAYDLAVMGERKTQLSLGHEKIPDAAAAERLKGLWRERLDALKELLEASGSD